MTIKVKRVYAKPDTGDGFRILVDRLWPRGMTTAGAKVDLWLKDVAPSAELRQWFAHDAKKWSEFKKRYMAELADQKILIGQIRTHAKKGVVTLLGVFPHRQAGMAGIKACRLCRPIGKNIAVSGGRALRREAGVWKGGAGIEPAPKGAR